MAAKLLFYYFGDDEAYFRTLQGEFNKHTRLQIEFKRFFETDEKKIQSLFLKVYNKHPAVVFIDFSKNTQDYLHLARVIVRTPLDHKVRTIGLVDYLSPPEILRESNATGVELTHIKGPENYDVVFDIVKLIAPNEIGEHGFATATFKETWSAGIPVKVGYIHREGIHIETDYPVKTGDKIKMLHHWMEKKIVPSSEFTIKDSSPNNLFYHFKRAVDCDFLFMDEFIPPEGMDEVDIIEKNKHRDEMVEHHKKQLKKWLDDNASSSLEKKAKVLVIDREFKFYDEQQRTDKHSYTIRCVPHVELASTVLDKLNPQVIAYSIEKENVEDRKNTLEGLSNLISSLKKRSQEKLPYIIVFNCHLSSSAAQNDYKYERLMTMGNEFSVEILVRMADVFNKKISLTSEIPGPSSDAVYLRKTSPASVAEILTKIEVIKISETDVIFRTEEPLEIGTNLHLAHPVNMYINVRPPKGQVKGNEYHGLIHGLGEIQKKELRRLVNSIFFRDHDAQIQAETEEFIKLNEAKLKEKEEAQKAEEEDDD